jgi:SPX domain protein involved in polyphosphate accumulation
VNAPSITRQRLELKYKVNRQRIAEFSRRIAGHVTEHRFQGEGANRLPRARHYITTVYFDTSSRDLYRAVREDDDNLKIRAREYYDVHPDLLELATSAHEINRHGPVCWVEVKGKQAGRTYKRRIGIPKSDLAAFFEQGVVSQGMRDLKRPKRAEQDEAVIDELLALRERYREPLRPSCLVNYRRTAFQDPTDALRITIDQSLACYRVPADPWQQPHSLHRDQLGLPAYEENACVVELKSKEPAPDWLAALLSDSGAQLVTFSKFLTASEAVHGLANERPKHDDA